ncbi:hypothetical protein ACJJTC_014042 [Scirpophaga incertulas]
MTIPTSCWPSATARTRCTKVTRRARALPLALHADNLFAYFYYSDKNRRTEIATLELYEGKERFLAGGAAFSSLRAPRHIDVRRAAYVLRGQPRAAAVTRTERGLTDLHLLLGLTTGSVMSVPWAHVEASGVEGAPLPELALPADAALAYNRRLARVTLLHAAPAGLESTSLVLAAGLDLFYTRVAPSKTFDLLKDDFDYYLIGVVLAALAAGTYASKYFASRKTLKAAWN